MKLRSTLKKGVSDKSVMGRKLLVEIKESLEELEKAVKYAAKASSKERYTNALLAKNRSSHK